jgi:transcriptional regulator with XRE-family HTH domain
MTTGEIIRAERLNRRISCRQLAKKSGLSLSTIFRIENDVSNHHIATLTLITAALDMDIHDLISRSDNM